MLAAPIVDPFPPFAPDTYARWKRELESWISAQNGATTTQLMAKVIPVLPASAKVTGLEYMAKPELIPRARTNATLLDALDERYGKTDAGESFSWITAFAEFAKPSSGRYEESRPLFSRRATSLDSLRMKLSGRMVFNKAANALRLPEGELPIVLSAHETKHDPTSVLRMKLSGRIAFNKSAHALRLPDGGLPIAPPALETKHDPTGVPDLKDITSRLSEPHRVHVDKSDAFKTNVEEAGGQSTNLPSPRRRSRRTTAQYPRKRRWRAAKRIGMMKTMMATRGETENIRGLILTGIYLLFDQKDQ